jgi:Tfp pilus assembly protein PilO
MKRDLLIVLLFVVLLGGLWLYYSQVIAKQPELISYYDRKIEESNQRLLSAQILSKNLRGVSSLIKENIAESTADSLAQGSSLEFLEFINDTVDKLGIKLVSLKPMEPINENLGYIRIPYNIEILASYNELGRFLTQLEKSPRIVNIMTMNLNNSLGGGISSRLQTKPDQHHVQLSLELLTLLRKGTIVESK